MKFKRIFIIVVDACGIGALPDASEYGDEGAATLQNMAKDVGGLSMPTCQMLGLGNIDAIEGIEPMLQPIGSYGKMNEKSAGKDSTSGHWEIGGIVLEKPFPLFPEGFPDKIVKEFEDKAGVKTCWNKTASGTEIIERLGEHHLKTKEIILYTSADSVFQLAAHEDIFPLDKQYEICQIARDMLTGEFAVGRVIARPFKGEVGSFERTGGRRDFSLEPPDDTILDILKKNGHPTLAIGKIYDLFAHRGITNHIKTNSNTGGMLATLEAVKNDDEHSLIMTNLVDGDQLWGHRRDAKNFAKSLEEFDNNLGTLLPELKDDNLLIITADHGCDPTFVKHTDHTREYVPLLVYSKKIKNGVDLGVRETFADIAATVLENFGFDKSKNGLSFLSDLQ